MNPYLEGFWDDVHTRLVGYIADALGMQLPSGLVACTEERVSVDESFEDGALYRPDVALVESWREGRAAIWSPESESALGGVATLPEIIRVDEFTERWIEIRTPHGRVITVIEVLSPTNKWVRTPGRSKYLRKQADYLSSQVNLVEIDLLRTGVPVLPLPAEWFEQPDTAPYHACVVRAAQPEKREVYPIPMRQRLPTLRIPLRPEDSDAILDLQPMIDRCYEMGGYWQGDYRADPVPPIAEDDRAWVDECLRAAGLR